MSSRRFFLCLIVTSVLAAGCETPRPDHGAAVESESEVTAETEGALSAAEIDRLVARAQTARDRELAKVPAFVPLGDAGESAPESLSESLSDIVAGEQRLLGEVLFDLSEPVGVSRAPWAALARYDAAKNRIIYAPEKADRKELDIAILAAVVEAIDAQHFNEFQTPTSWDAALAAAAARQATVLFAVATDLLGATHPDISIELLAKRPELAINLPLMEPWLGFSPVVGAERSKTVARQQKFVTREAWKLATALYRSSGWSGVELAGAMPPGRTADVVRPDLWMRGELVGRWTWPEESDTELTADRRGLVGPGLISIWLEDVVDPRLVQSIYAGYISDAYRYFEASDAVPPTPTRFEWLSLWSSPGSAQQVAGAFERRLRERFRGEASEGASFTVFSKGLVVGVIIDGAPGDDASQQARRLRAEHLLDAHKVELVPRKGLPTGFVPTRADALAAAMAGATMDARVWQGPAANLRVDLSGLGEDWKVQQPDLSELRWFARHRDGSILQLTVELDNPLGPAFDSDVYRQEVAEALRASMKQAKIEAVDFTTPADTGALSERGFVVRVRGRIDGAERVVKLWEFHRGDLLISYSLQAPPEDFEAHEKDAAAILRASQKLHASTRPARDLDDARGQETGGSIEYRVEE